MLNLLRCNEMPIENSEDQPYAQMAFDGIFFYCCTGRTCKVYKLNLKGRLICCIDTKRAFGSICFDCKDKCFWAMTPNCRRSVFKLDSCLCEIGSINIPYQDNFFKDISYSAKEDMLLLCGGKSIVKLSKSGNIVPVYSGRCGAELDAVVGMDDTMFIGCRFQGDCPHIISVLHPNYCLDYLVCMPKSFTLNNLCIGYGCDNTVTLFVLATQNYRYSYLIQYCVESCDDLKLCCLPHTENACDQDDTSGCIYIGDLDVRADITIGRCGEEQSC